MTDIKFCLARVKKYLKIFKVVGYTGRQNKKECFSDVSLPIYIVKFSAESENHKNKIFWLVDFYLHTLSTPRNIKHLNLPSNTGHFLKSFDEFENNKNKMLRQIGSLPPSTHPGLASKFEFLIFLRKVYVTIHTSENLIIAILRFSRKIYQ